MDHYFSVHRVQPGETLTAIARAAGFRHPDALVEFRRNGHLVDPDRIVPGDVVFVPSSRESLSRELARNRQRLREAGETLADYHSSWNNGVRAVFKAFGDLSNALGGVKAAGDARKYAALRTQIGDLSNRALELARKLQRQRAGGVMHYLLGIANDHLGEIGRALREADSALAIDDQVAATRWCKIALRHMGKLNSVLDLAKIGDVKDPKSLLGAAGKTVDAAMLAIELGLYAGEFLAACSPKADMGLFLHGFAEYDRQVGEELQRAMLQEVEWAQSAISRITFQLQSAPYRYAL